MNDKNDINFLFELVEAHSKNGSAYGQNIEYDEMRKANAAIVDGCKAISAEKSQVSESDKRKFYETVFKYGRMGYIDDYSTSMLGQDYRNFRQDYIMQRIRGYASKNTSEDVKTDIDTSSVSKPDEGVQMTFDDIM